LVRFNFAHNRRRAWINRHVFFTRASAAVSGAAARRRTN
jgi:hypothetical protein